MGFSYHVCLTPFLNYVQLSSGAEELKFGLNSILVQLVALVLFCLIVYIPSTIFQNCIDRSAWVESVLS